MDKVFVQEKLRLRHCEDLARHLSTADHSELFATGELAHDETLQGVLSKAVNAEGCTHYAIRNKHSGVTYCIGGFNDEGLCWFLTSKLVKRFNQNERAAFKQMLTDNLMNTLKVHPVLHNAVWAENVRHQHLVDAMGARWGAAITNELGHKFLPFTFHREDYPLSN